MPPSIVQSKWNKDNNLIGVAGAGQVWVCLQRGLVLWPHPLVMMVTLAM